MPSNAYVWSRENLHDTTRIPRLPSEYAIRKTASPDAGLPSSIVSVRVAGNGKSNTGSHLTSPVTSYVPLAQTVCVELHVVHVPPPSVELFDPGPPPGATT